MTKKLTAFRPAALTLFFLSLAASTAPLPAQEARFLRGDSNADGDVDISDPVAALGLLFLGQGQVPCADAADSNDDGELDISDAINALGFLFTGGGAIPGPGPEECGPDPTADLLGCESFPPCPGGPPPTAFRIVDLDLRDPHMFVNFLGCRDVTDSPLVGFAVNQELEDSISLDGDGDGLLDLSFLLVFRPLDQALPGGGALDLAHGDCTSPASSTTCRGAQILIGAHSTNSAGDCLGPLAGTTRPYVPAVAAVGPPCFSSAPPGAFDLILGGIPVSLREVQVAATYEGDPAAELLGGLIRGFLRRTDADATIIPASFPLVGGEPLSALLPGGDPAGAGRNCAPHSDLDQGPDGQGGQTPGWWFYFAFAARRVDLDS